MIDRFMEMRLAIEKLRSGPQEPLPADHVLSAHDWTLLSVLHVLLAPLRDVVRALEGDKYPTYHLIFPYLLELKRRYTWNPAASMYCFKAGATTLTQTTMGDVAKPFCAALVRLLPFLPTRLASQPFPPPLYMSAALHAAF